MLLLSDQTDVSLDVRLPPLPSLSRSPGRAGWPFRARGLTDQANLLA